MPTVQFGGLASGLDTNSIIDGLVDGERIPIRNLERRRAEAERSRDLYRDLASATTQLKGIAAELNAASAVTQLGVTSSDANRLGVSIAVGAVTGTYEVEIQSRARTTQLAGQGYADAAASGVLGTGTAVLDVGGTPVNLTIGAGQDSLDGLRDAINAAGLDVQATVIDDGSGATAQRLVIRGTKTGTQNAVSLDTSGLTGGSQALSLSALSAAQDAVVVVDGLTVTRSENTLRDVIPGVTLDLGAETAPGETIRVEVDLDQEATADRVAELVDAYRDIVNRINDASQPGDEGVSAGPLLGDALASTARRRLQSASSGAVGAGSILTPVDMGIDTDRSGNIELDRAALISAIENEPDNVATLVADLATRLEAAADELTTDGTGLLEVRADSLDSRARDLTRQIERREDSLEGFEEMLRRRFTALESLSSRFQSQAGLIAGLSPIPQGGNQ